MKKPSSIAEGNMAPSSNDDSVTRTRHQNDDGKTNSQHSIRGHHPEHQGTIRVSKGVGLFK